MALVRAALSLRLATRAVPPAAAPPRTAAASLPRCAVRGIASGFTNGIKWYNANTNCRAKYPSNFQWTVVPLGTVSAIAAPTRAVSATFLRASATSRASGFLVDAGEGTTEQLKRCYVASLDSIRNIFITHLHADHVFGLPGLVTMLTTVRASINQAQEEIAAAKASRRPNEDITVNDRGKYTINIFGPVGLYNLLHAALLPTGRRKWEEMPIMIHELVPLARADSWDGKPYSPKHRFVYPSKDDYGYRLLEASTTDNGFESPVSVVAAPIKHNVPCYGYVFTEATRRRVDQEALARLGIAPGPVIKSILQGENVIAPNGQKVILDEVAPPLPSRKVAILGDNCDASMLVSHAMNADLVVHEATLLGVDAHKAQTRFHSTPTMAGKFAAACKAQRLLLTHFSGAADATRENACIHFLGRPDLERVVRQTARASGGSGADVSSIGVDPEADAAASADTSTAPATTPAVPPISRSGGSDDADIMASLAASANAPVYLEPTMRLYRDALLETNWKIQYKNVETTVRQNLEQLKSIQLGKPMTTALYPAADVTKPTFPPVRESIGMMGLTQEAQEAFGSKRVICARDFMAIPIFAKEPGAAPDTDGDEPVAAAVATAASSPVAAAASVPTAAAAIPTPPAAGSAPASSTVAAAAPTAASAGSSATAAGRGAAAAAAPKAPRGAASQQGPRRSSGAPSQGARTRAAASKAAASVVAAPAPAAPAPMA